MKWGHRARKAVGWARRSVPTRRPDGKRFACARRARTWVVPEALPAPVRNYTRTGYPTVRKAWTNQTGVWREENSRSSLQKVEHGGLGQDCFGNAVTLRAGTLLGGLRGLQVGAKVARALDDAPSDRQALRLEASQCRLDLLDLERRRQCRGVVSRLGNAGCDMRSRDEGRVANDRDSAECHARRLEIIDRLQDRLVDQAHHLAKLRREQPLGGRAHLRDRFAPDQRRGDRYRVERTLLIGQQVRELGALVRGPIPDHVVAAVAGTQIIVGTRNWIAQALLARGEAECHVVEQLAVNRRWKRRLRDERAPSHVADIARHEFRQALLADGGTKAVRTHQQFALDRAAVAQVRDDRRLRLHKAGDAAAAVIALRRKGVAQQPIDALPR